MMDSNVLEQPEISPVKTEEKRTVLIVDDDSAMVDVLTRRLKSQGFRTESASSGAAGLAKARSLVPSLILLDLRLPDTDGFTVCERLADELETCTIPVIILSGMERPDIVRRCRAAGCHFFVRKPYDPNALLALIQQAIEQDEP